MLILHKFCDDWKTLLKSITSFERHKLFYLCVCLSLSFLFSLSLSVSLCLSPSLILSILLPSLHISLPRTLPLSIPSHSLYFSCSLSLSLSLTLPLFLTIFLQILTSVPVSPVRMELHVSMELPGIPVNADKVSLESTAKKVCPLYLCQLHFFCTPLQSLSSRACHIQFDLAPSLLTPKSRKQTGLKSFKSVAPRPAFIRNSTDLDSSKTSKNIPLRFLLN